MLFISKFFLFAFLPLTLIGFYLTSRNLGRTPALVFLFAASMFFYGYNYPPYVAAILLSYGVNYVGARALQRSGSRALLVALLCLNLGYLGYFKYYDFFVQNINTALGVHLPLLHVVLPLGISFYTFQQIPYLVGAFQKQFEHINFLKYVVVNSFFPHLIAGPIIWHREIAPQLERPGFGVFDPSDFARGVTFFAIGLFKKVILADSLAYVADDIFKLADAGAPLTFGDSWIGALAYGLQLYFDFSGYSEMAIGLALMFGIRFPINFFSPYKATSIIEFWTRWHMTMTRFFQEYVYLPMQFAIGRRSSWVGFRYLAIVIMMFLVGLWHGAGWTWVFWGCAHGALLVINHLWRGVKGHLMPGLSLGPFGRLVGWTLTYLAVTACWVLFRSKDFATAEVFYKVMFFWNGLVLPESFGVFLGPSITNLLASIGFKFQGSMIVTSVSGLQIAGIFGLVAFVALMPNTVQLMGYFTSVRTRNAFSVRSATLTNFGSWLSWRPSWNWALLTSILVVAAFTSIFDDTAKSVFIYFNF